MTKYIIKDNLPEKAKNYAIDTNSPLYTAEARSAFLRYANSLADYYSTKMTFRNEKGSALRGTIQVEIDGFYYYVELYKEQ